MGKHWEMNTSFDDMKMCSAIAKRAQSNMELFKHLRSDFMSVVMDLQVAHNAYPMRLADLLESDDGNFWHDVGGIVANVNRQTLQIDNGFLPRFTA